MKKATGYIRVSTTGQAIDGVSLEAQRAKIEAWATLNDYELVDVHVDAGISGSRMDTRPGLQDALDQACEHGAALVVYSLSRLARSTADAIAISDRLGTAGADLVSLSESIDTTSAAGKMVFRMLAVLSEFERDLVSERTSAALQHKKANGERVGNIEYGYRLADDGTTLLEDEHEREVVRRIHALRGEGLSLRAIGTRLEEMGVLTRSGKRWAPQTLSRIVERAA